jgi:hypothetical protein
MRGESLFCGERRESEFRRQFDLGESLFRSPAFSKKPGFFGCVVLR